MQLRIEDRIKDLKLNEVSNNSYSTSWLRRNINCRCNSLVKSKINKNARTCFTPSPAWAAPFKDYNFRMVQHPIAYGILLANFYYYFLAFLSARKIIICALVNSKLHKTKELSIKENHARLDVENKELFPIYK